MTDSYENDPSVTTLVRPKVKRPDLYKVVMLNDDYTTMEFVIHVLQKYFHKSSDEAYKIMLTVHQQGKGIAGIYPYDVAATKIIEVGEYAKKNNMPLKCTMETA